MQKTGIEWADTWVSSTGETTWVDGVNVYSRATELPDDWMLAKSTIVERMD